MSRVAGTTNLAQALANAKLKPRVFISSSAIGYYGDRGDEILKEASAAGTGFLPDVCREWEMATEAAAKAGIRTVQIRTGVVLTTTGGALAKMLTPFKLGLGGIVGSGLQWMSWIAVQDMVGAIQHIRENRSTAWSSQPGRADSRQQCGVHEDSGGRAVASGNFSDAGICREVGVWRDGRDCAAGKPASGTWAIGCERIFVSVPRVAGLAES